MSRSTYERRLRVRKAIALETHIATSRQDLKPPDVRRMPPSARKQLAEAAGVSPPSTETWRLLCLLLEGQQLPEEYR